MVFGGRAGWLNPRAASDGEDIGRDLHSGVALVRFFSTLMLVTGLGPVLAPQIGSWALSFTSWRGIFLILAGFGLLRTEHYPLLKGPVFQSYAIGLLLRNENLLNASFQVSMGIYPGLDGHPLKLNPSLSFSVKFRSFSIPKPSVISYD